MLLNRSILNFENFNISRDLDATFIRNRTL